MRRVVALFAWGLMPTWVSAEDIAYITDLSLLNSLASCASNAVTRVIGSQTFMRSCSTDATELQSCICTKRHDEVAESISSLISYSCGQQSSFAATKQQSSASTVLAAYCNQEATITFPAPEHPVSSYIYELDGYSELAPCASLALSRAVQSNTHFDCPPLPTDFAPCICEMEKNSASVNELIKSSVAQDCYSRTADISSAQAFFAAYCKMNLGTTSMPTATNPPGDMTYFVTEMSQYHSLSTCAQSAIQSAVISQTWTNCPKMGPQELASCVCIKDKMSNSVSSSVSNYVHYKCLTKVMDNLDSANDVFGLYCSAARAEITEHVYVTASYTGTSRSTGTGDGDNGDSKNHGTSTGVIVGAVVGSVFGALVAFGAMCLLKRRGRRRGQTRPADLPLRNQAQTASAGHANTTREAPHNASTSEDVILPSTVDATSAPPPYEAGPDAKLYLHKGH